MNYGNDYGCPFLFKAFQKEDVPAVKFILAQDQGMSWLRNYRVQGKMNAEVRGLSGPGAGTYAFLKRCGRVSRYARLATELTRVVGIPMNDAAALFGSHRMLVADRENFEHIVPDLPPGASVLDVGAGIGDTTLELKGHKRVERIVATEASTLCCARLRFVADEVRRTRTLESAVAHAEKYDLVSLLNVLDRTERPDSMLQDAAKIGSRLLIGLVYDPYAQPFVQPHLFEPRLPTTPIETDLFDRIRHQQDGDSFESFITAAANSLSEATGGFRIEAIARTPYICAFGESDFSFRKHIEGTDQIESNNNIVFLDQALILLSSTDVKLRSE